MKDTKTGLMTTQSQIIINAIRDSGSRGMTYGELLGLKASTCPWKRVREGAKHLKAGEQIDRYEGGDGLIRIRIVILETV